MEDYEEQREQLQETVDRDEEELRAAVEDLKEAVSRPFQLADRLAKNPLPWIFSALLIGFVLGSASGSNDNGR